ncbi:hypothetical protein ART_2009 [Arthrobacter sp. PAMC 25486]|nr:hypothetical protein ART_2009 [Arthrobacter sp. PAMC 25486]
MEQGQEEVKAELTPEEEAAARADARRRQDYGSYLATRGRLRIIQ